MFLLLEYISSSRLVPRRLEQLKKKELSVILIHNSMPVDRLRQAQHLSIDRESQILVLNQAH